MKILDRLPIGDEPETLLVGTEAVTIKRFQIFVWTSMNASHPFPAILDSGHSHNFSITESQLVHWAGLPSRQLKLIGATRLKGEKLWQLQADVRLHRNQPGNWARVRSRSRWTKASRWHREELTQSVH